MTRKVLLGLAAWLPLLAVLGLAFYLTAAIVALGIDLPTIPDLNDPEVKRLLLILFAGAAVIALLQIAFSVAFIIDASGRRAIRGAPLALWALGFVFFGEVLFPVYWLLYVVRDRRPGPMTTEDQTSTVPRSGS